MARYGTTMNNTATERRTDKLAAAAKGPAYSVKTLTSTVELAASASGQTINFGEIPSNARICLASSLYWDDLATSGSPTIDIGLAAVNGNLANADDPDALSNGHAVSATTTSGASALSEIANAGLPAWDLVASETADPGGSLAVYGTVKDAATTATGTVTLELYYYVD